MSRRRTRTPDSIRAYKREWMRRWRETHVIEAKTQAYRQEVRRSVAMAHLRGATSIKVGCERCGHPNEVPIPRGGVDVRSGDE